MPSFEDLDEKIIQTGLCTACGACFSACLSSYINFVDDRPKRPVRKLECVSCSTCYDACYMLRRGLMENIGGSIFQGRTNENIGIYKRILSARTRDQNIEKACQDGGIVTSLLVGALNEDLIDGALVVGRDGWRPIPSIAKTKAQVISSSKTKYGVAPLLKELRSAVVDQGLSRICMVGSPCHIQSIRYLQHKGLPFASAVKYTIGLFCRENYSFQCIEENLNEYGLKIEEVDKFDISEEFNIWADGKKISYPITTAKNWVPKHCLVCEDLTSELADVSIGSNGSPVGWSTVILRTEEGEDLFLQAQRAGILENQPLGNLGNLKELAYRKRTQGKYTSKIFSLKEKGLQRHEITAKLGISEQVSEKLRLSEEWWSYRIERF